MDFLDPKIERRNRTLLVLGYCLTALAIGLTTLVLLLLAYGYNLDKKGQVIYKGFVFVSSQPSGATITLNGKKYGSPTNTRLNIAAGSYMLQISKAGYRSWQRPVTVLGGDVQHFDYPFLFPTQLKTTSLGDLAASPSIATQSPDKRWLLLGSASKPGTFLEYDLGNPAKPVQAEISLPDGSFTPGDGAQTWSLVEWSADSKDVLLLHTYVTAGVTDHEYVLFNRDTPTASVNLTSTLGLTADETLNLYNSKVDQFYIYNQSAQTLRRVNASDGSEVSRLEHVLAYKPYGSGQLLYVTDTSPTGKETTGGVSVVFQDGQKAVTLRSLPAAAPSYVLNLAQYSGDWYIAVAASNDSAVYIYRNPQSETTSTADTYPAPWRRLPLNHPSYLAFSNNTQFLLAESGQDFYTYDFENVAQYHYTAKQPLDTPQTHATWMDGDRLLYVSGGKLLVFDYDYRNQQALMPADPAYLPFFASNYSYLYSLTPGSGATVKPALTSTSLTAKP